MHITKEMCLIHYTVINKPGMSTNKHTYTELDRDRTDRSLDGRRRHLQAELEPACKDELPCAPSYAEPQAAWESSLNIFLIYGSNNSR